MLYVQIQEGEPMKYPANSRKIQVNLHKTAPQPVGKVQMSIFFIPLPSTIALPIGGKLICVVIFIDNWERMTWEA